MLEITTSARSATAVTRCWDATPAARTTGFGPCTTSLDMWAHVSASTEMGKFGAWLTQERLYDGLARWALATELHAEHSVRWTTGTLSDHKATLIDRDLLNKVRSV